MSRRLKYKVVEDEDLPTDQLIKDIRAKGENVSEEDEQKNEFSKEKSRIDEVHLVCYHTDFWNSEVSCKVRD